ncbi:phytanoyl-CoA dioxygenase, peroxisomal-like isoform X2 [Nomia melanderi]|nr:phytanoyl-CoA dioxygenase, peroxisomal-like isoform X2 [Nomia melanderi]XP_031840753.1 phytanoyl-CoA dioxygenase, peroxisomal-like isoform X2 [Nomia melanderi]XP_031840754.1 phytanoyl-CoA dioxygenase, peroxisomal-like isoform X2 [Nomia melanderi]XP_031840755.1 phytanoyl-CoA dioxygenase, peroxisomal-like isoform X2 [Nomia melanderi]XP_031840756.1 phytanoyl-CoA dioxygenase, peroxisomal-like isoform X2 [Nomia melanderi]XP_031840757.1 phytanoyl-CoA dioxygenase, peroxisomal-like isoform X2 [Nomi
MSNNLRFTKENKNLTWKQRLFYEKNGYILLPRLVPMDVLDKCHKRFDDIVAGRAPRNGITVMYDVKDRKSVNKVQDIADDEVFREYIAHKNILDIVEAITGPNIMAMHSMLIAKPPDIGFGTSKHPPHQDLYYFPFRPADLIVASWTAMEPCTRENGCLFVASGTHALNRLHKHDYPPGSEPGSVNKFYHGILDLPDSTNWEYLEMGPGDTVFFHPLLIHGSGVNKTNTTRRAISCHYAAAECDYIDIKNSVQEDIANEIKNYMRKVSPGIDVEYSDLWRFKASLVRGIKSSL